MRECEPSDLFPSQSSAGLLANLQGQAATLLGSQPKDVTEALSAEPERPKEISIEQASVTLQGPRSTLAAKQFRSEAKPKEEGRVENDLESTLRDAVDVRTIGADSSGAGSVRIEDATRNGDPVSAWASEEQRTDLEDESAGSGLPRKPVKSVRVEDLDLDWIPGGNEHVKDKTIGVREGRLSDAGSSKAEPVTDLVRAKAAALGDKEGDDDHREASVRSKSGLLLKRGEGVTSKESGSQNLARQWGAETLDKMVLARGESEGDTRGESFREGREEPWKSLTGAGLVKGLANGTVNGTGFATRLANALGLAGELLSATADLDTLAKMTAEAIKVLSNGTSHAESVTGAAGFNKSLANATGLLETVLGNDTQASAFVEKLAGLGLTRREVEAVWARNGSAALEGTGEKQVPFRMLKWKERARTLY